MEFVAFQMQVFLKSTVGTGGGFTTALLAFSCKGLCIEAEAA